MLFEIIDRKQDCKNIYMNSHIVEDPQYDKLTGTWSYHPILHNYNVEFASLYAQYKTIDECCPDDLVDEWGSVKKRHMAYIRSFQNSFCDSYDGCFYDMVPHSFVVDYFGVKNKITEHVLNNYKKPENYDFLVELSGLVSEIEAKELNVDIAPIAKKLHQTKTRGFYKKLMTCGQRIEYNIFGTITGRLTTKKNSFPLLTLNKDYRDVIQPQNDWFVELDFNAAELRCLLALNEVRQPEQDIHDWHGSIFNRLTDRNLDRADVKQKIFSWLYGPIDASLGIPQIEKYYNKKKTIDKYWDGKMVKNYYGREIVADKFHSLNAIIQSTTSDTFLRRAIAVNKILAGKKSFTMGLIHDSMVIDFSREDKDVLEEMIREFGKTELGTFKVNASLGTDFGNMKRFR